MLLVMAFATNVLHAQNTQIRFTGTVTNNNGEVLTDATVVFEPVRSAHTKPSGQPITATNNNGYAVSLPDTSLYRITVSRIGYKKSVKITERGIKEQKIDFILQNNAEINEVVVTAAQTNTKHESIVRSAMEHLQPTSIADLTELLPGGFAKDPNMGAANTIAMRETGAMNAYGQSATNNNYGTSALGTLFVVDGAPISTDANMQYSPLSSTQSTTTGTSAEDSRNTTNRGVDMRSIGTDDIENVEVVQGIPSAEYGNLTSGMVLIKKIRRATPVIVRLKADGYSKLFGIGKGIDLSKHNTHYNSHILNIDLGWLDSKVDPTNNLENYKRITASARYTRQKDRNKFQSAIDYTGTFDKSKTDPNLNYGRIDDYQSNYSRVMLTNNLHLKKFERWSFDVNTSASIQFDRLKQTRLVAPQRYGIVPTGYGEGEQEAHAVFGEYVASYLCDGKPFCASISTKAKRTITRNDNNYIMFGTQWDYAKNFGNGQVYDMERPLSLTGWTSRPRKYSDIPALQNLSAYAELNREFPIKKNTFKLTAGVRLNTLPGLNSKFDMAGKFYADPRVNLSFQAKEIGDVKLIVNAGFGLTTKMPTLNYLYPDKSYSNFNSLVYYDQENPTENSKFVVTTFVQDPTNYNLKPARNQKWELSLAAYYGNGGNATVKLFYEKMNDGFRYSNVYNAYSYNKYSDKSMTDYKECSTLDGYTQVTNGSKIIKQGVELTLNFGRIKAIQTAVNVTGAWFRTQYLNSQPMFESVSGVIDDTTISSQFVGLYDWNDGKINQRANTNITFDTQIPKFSLIFTTSVQTVWFISTKTMWKNGTPVAYISAADGKMHEFDEQSAKDAYLQQLVKTYNADLFKTFTVPMSTLVNLKVTKSIGKNLKLSMFANKILDYLPTYTANGRIIRRSASPYFGMEANIYL